MLRRLIAFFAFVVTFLIALMTTTRASAAIVNDAGKLTVDLGKARICWVSPIELRTAEDCDGLTPEAVPEPHDTSARIIAMGLVRLEQPGEAPDLGLVMVMHVPLPLTAEPDEGAAKEYAVGAQKAVAKELRAGARMRPPTNARIMRTARHPLIRVVLDADGIPEGAEDQLLEHQIHVAGVADDGMYSVAWLSKRRDAKRIEVYADASAASFHMTKPAASQKDFEKKVELVLGLVFALGALLVGGVIAIIVVASRKKPAPYAYPYPYHAQPSSYPPPAWHPASAHHAQQPWSPAPSAVAPVAPSIPPPPAMPRREWWDELQ